LGWTLLLNDAIPKNEDPIGDLSHHGKIVAYVKCGGALPPNGVLEGFQDAKLSRDVESRGRLVEHKEPGTAAHCHSRHEPLKLPSRNLVRVSAADRLWVWKCKLTKQLERSRACLDRTHRVVHESRLNNLLAYR
jgi:hypothetical protein